MGLVAIVPKMVKPRTSGSVNVPIFVVKAKTDFEAIFQEKLIAELSQDSRMSVFQINSFQEIPELLVMLRSGVVICSVPDEKELKNLIPILNTIPFKPKEGISNHFLITFPSQEFKPLFHRLDVTVVEPLVEIVKEFTLKRVQDLESGFSEKWDFFQTFHNEDRMASQNPSLLQWDESITDVEDFWLIGGNKKVELKGEHWIVRALGPHSLSGYWKKEEFMGRSAWKWSFLSSVKLPIGQDAGSWYFFGNEPVFRKGEWVFSGIGMSLELYSGQEFRSKRFYVESQQKIIVHQNSDQALWWLPHHLVPQVSRASVLDTKLSIENLPSYIAPENKQKTQNGFYKIDNFTHVFQVFQLGLKQKSPILFWLKDNETHFRTFIVRVDGEMNCYEIRMPMTQSFRDQIIAQSKDPEAVWFFRCFFESEHVFFQTQMLEIDGDKIRFRLPEHLFELQRRADPRYRASARMTIMVQVEGPLRDERWSLQLKDLSSGGCALLVPTDKISSFEQGNKTIKMKFEIGNRSFQILSEIRYVMPDADYPGMSRVGVRYLNLSQENTKFVRYYVIQMLTDSHQ